MEKPISTIIVRNILGCICGLVVGWLAYMFIGVIFGFLFSIEWVAKLAIHAYSIYVNRYGGIRSIAGSYCFG